MNNGEELKKVELRELQPLLSHTFGDQLIVVRYTTKNLLQPGENYCSNIFNVHAVIKRNDQAEEEDLYLVAKMPLPLQSQLQTLDSPTWFKKEIFMYESAIPHYKQLERDAGLKDDELFDILPRYYQSRLSLSPDIDFDDNAVILVENLKKRGYYICDRTKGCDFEHSKVAIRALARFHALGIATRYKQPEYFKVLKERSKCTEITEKHMEWFEDALDNTLKKIAEDPEIVVHVDRCRTAMNNTKKDGLWDIQPADDDPWSTIVHSDFWINNIMFHRDDNGRVDDIKFVDFQFYLCLNPLREIVFYLFTSTDVSTYDNDDRLEELKDLYYETFVAVLTRLDCDTESFTREKFDAKLKDDAKFEFIHIFIMLKTLTLNAKEDGLETNEMNFMESCNQACVQRQRKLISHFVRYDWI